METRKKMYDRKLIGDAGEDFAAKILTMQGYQILERKYRSKAGEIDIIAEKSDELIFVEVKTRKSVNFGTPAESVTLGKQRHIRNTASYYLKSHGRNGGFVSFQVIEILFNQIENAF